jgi:hypothetical protein
MELESTKLQEKSLFTTDDLHHIWVSSDNRGVMTIHVTDSVNKIIYDVAEFSNGTYNVIHSIYFNNIFLKNIRKYPHKITSMFKFYIDQKEESLNQFKTISVSFNCFKRKFSVYIHRTLNKTKRLIWE